MFTEWNPYKAYIAKADAIKSIKMLIKQINIGSHLMNFDTLPNKLEYGCIYIEMTWFSKIELSDKVCRFGKAVGA